MEKLNNLRDAGLTLLCRVYKRDICIAIGACRDLDEINAFVGDDFTSYTVERI